MVTINLNFDGYYTEGQLERLGGHQCGGVYIVYAGKPTVPSRCSLRKILYVGKSQNVAERPSSNHHKYQAWKNSLANQEILYFSFADVEDEARAEAALIYHLQPACNENGKESFNYETTTINSLGNHAFILNSFIVERT